MSLNDQTWGICVHSSLLKIGLGILGGALFSNLTETAIGIISGAIGSAVVVSEMPMVIGTGLGIGWALRHCKNILRKPDPSQATHKEEDPCACCNSNFEALDKNEFETTTEPKDSKQPPPPVPQKSETYRAEEKCTCNEIPVTWSPPRPAEDDSLGCSCYR